MIGRSGGLVRGGGGGGGGGGAAELLTVIVGEPIGSGSGADQEQPTVAQRYSPPQEMPTPVAEETPPIQARQGRQQQRYGQAGERLVAGCIPIRYIENGQGADGVQVLLVSRRCGKGWSFPKGGWETDEQTAEQAAQRETVEEAGVLGTIEEPLLGAFPFLSQKRCNSKDGQCLAYIYVMRVEKQLDVWPEQKERQRCWFSIPEVCDRCGQDWMRQALYVWVKRRGWESICNHLESVEAPVMSNSKLLNGVSNAK